jgi:hypothetical protein
MADKTLSQIIGEQPVRPWSNIHAAYLESWLLVVNRDRAKITANTEITDAERVELLDALDQIGAVIGALRRPIGALLP